MRLCVALGCVGDRRRRPVLIGELDLDGAVVEGEPRKLVARWIGRVSALIGCSVSSGGTDRSGSDPYRHSTSYGCDANVMSANAHSTNAHTTSANVMSANAHSATMTNGTREGVS
jgi:hypothetical protein